MGDKEYVIGTHGDGTEENKEAKSDQEARKRNLNRKIELSSGFGGELRRSLGDFEETKKRKGTEEKERQGKVADQLPTIQEENENAKWI